MSDQVATNTLDLYSHIKHLCKTTIPAYLISAAVYFFIGLNTETTNDSIDSAQQTVEQITHLYHIHWILAVPIFIVLAGALLKKPVIPVLLLATAISIAISYFIQNISIIENLNIWVSGFSVSMLTCPPLNVPEAIRNLLERGGVMSMMPLILIILCAFSFAGPLALTQALDIIISYLTRMADSSPNCNAKPPFLALQTPPKAV